MPTVNKIRRPWETKKQQPAPNQGRKVANRDVYDTTRWRKIRALHLQAHPLCEECRKKGLLVEAKVVDHITPINQGGDAWESSNHQSLCFKCHQKKSANERHGKSST